MIVKENWNGLHGILQDLTWQSVQVPIKTPTEKVECKARSKVTQHKIKLIPFSFEVQLVQEQPIKYHHVFPISRPTIELRLNNRLRLTNTQKLPIFLERFARQQPENTIENNELPA